MKYTVTKNFKLIPRILEASIDILMKILNILQQLLEGKYHSYKPSIAQRLQTNRLEASIFVIGIRGQC